MRGKPRKESESRLPTIHVNLILQPKIAVTLQYIFNSSNENSTTEANANGVKIKTEFDRIATAIDQA